MITAADVRFIIAELGEVAREDIEWAEGLGLPEDAEEFAQEVIFVVCNSGMKNTVARAIFERCVGALQAGKPVFDVFKHPGKAAAIERIWRERDELFAECLYRASKGPDELLAFARALPWIGPITAAHVVKNFGVDIAKADLHLQRLADRERCTAQDLCARLAKDTGYRIATVDTLLWRACANGVLDSRTGRFRT
jgi:hypothetical protein